MLKKNAVHYFIAFSLLWSNFSTGQSEKTHVVSNKEIDLSGEWKFKIDSLDAGIKEKWFTKKLDDTIDLPGSMTTNKKGNNISINTPWTGSIVDSSWFTQPEYAKFRQPENIKVPFWLQPVKYYKGAAWYQKIITIPESWKGENIELFIERSHWETTAWINDQQVGMQNSLGTPHTFNLPKALTPGKYQITIRVDNRIKDFNVGENSHSISDHTQSNWNGMIGKLLLKARASFYVDDVQLYPDIKKNQVLARMVIKNTTGKPINGSLQLIATSTNQRAEKLNADNKKT